MGYPRVEREKLSARVSISSPSSEGGGKKKIAEEIAEAKEKFPLVLLQAKVVGETSKTSLGS